MSGNYSYQLGGKPIAETAVVLNTLLKNTSEEDIVLLGMKTVLVVEKGDTAAMFVKVTSLQNIEIRKPCLQEN